LLLIFGWLVLLNLFHEATQTRARVSLQDLHAEDLGDVALGSEHDPVEHALAILVDDVALVVDQVAPSVHFTALAINEISIGVLFEDWLRQRAHFIVTRDVVNIELGEEEDFGELAVLQVLLDEDALALPINDVAISVNQVALVVDAAAHVVHKRAIIAALDYNVSICIFVKDAHHILDVKAASTVVKKLLDIAVVKLLPVELLATLLVHDVSVASLDEPAEAVNSAALLVHIEALFSLKKLWNRAASALIVLELQVTHQVVRVEIELLNTEWSRDLALVIEVVLREHLLLRVVLQNVAS